MVVVKNVEAKSISDSRGEKTIEVHIKTNAGSFFASAPNGKSKGKWEAKSYRKNLEEDIKTLKKLSDYFSDEKISFFGDLEKIEDILSDSVGANTIIAFEYAILKALAKEKNKEIWQLINASNAGETRKFPRLVGNCIGGGKHSSNEKKPDFQEFLLIPEGSVKESFQILKKAKKDSEFLLKEYDKKFNEEKNDENAWETSLNEKEVLEVLNELKIPLGLDIAASGFYQRKSYHYKNPVLKRDKDEQLKYISNLITNFNLFYIEDPFDENDFESFSEILKKFPESLIVGDDLITTNPERFEKAIKMKSVNAVIVKPNQIGSLIKVREICELAGKNKIKTVFSHRSGETNESILADLAFGFQADFLKSGITGDEREIKINRLIEIENRLRNP